MRYQPCCPLTLDFQPPELWENKLLLSHPGYGISQVVLVVKNPPANAGDVRDAGSIPGLRRSCGGGHGNPL